MKIALLPLKFLGFILLFILSIVLTIIGSFVTFISAFLGAVAFVIGIIVGIGALALTIIWLLHMNEALTIIHVCIGWISAFILCSVLFSGVRIGEIILNAGKVLGKKAKSLINNNHDS
ncbi:MAG: hypothetical protein II842_00460 [Butyrivibrio sp.]|nr:hypothetical protein [Butyrivibrio sp.]